MSVLVEIKSSDQGGEFIFYCKNSHIDLDVYVEYK